MEAVSILLELIDVAVMVKIPDDSNWWLIEEPDAVVPSPKSHVIASPPPFEENLNSCNTQVISSSSSLSPSSISINE